MQAINISYFIDYNSVLDRIKYRIKRIRDSKLAIGFDRILLPSEKEYELKSLRKKEEYN